jgi:hypothetical protein
MVRPLTCADCTSYMDQGVGAARLPVNPHFFTTSPTHQNTRVRTIAQGAQRRIAEFFASDGTAVVYPEPARFFELPLAGPLHEVLNDVR